MRRPTMDELLAEVAQRHAELTERYGGGALKASHLGVAPRDRIR
jgi:hypothetical protein